MPLGSSIVNSKRTTVLHSMLPIMSMYGTTLCGKYCYLDLTEYLLEVGFKPSECIMYALPVYTDVRRCPRSDTEFYGGIVFFLLYQAWSMYLHCGIVIHSVILSPGVLFFISVLRHYPIFAHPKPCGHAGADQRRWCTYGIVCVGMEGLTTSAFYVPRSVKFGIFSM